MLKKLVLFMVLSLALFGFDKSMLNGKIHGTSSCPVCGMDIKKFYKTSHAVKINSNKRKKKTV